MTEEEKIVTELVKIEERLASSARPTATGAIIRWRGHIYIGSVQPIGEAFVVVGKTTSPYDFLYDAFKRLHPDRIELLADDEIDFSKPCFFARYIESEKSLLKLDPKEERLLEAIVGSIELIGGQK